MEQGALQENEDHSETCTRKSARHLNICHHFVRRILEDLQSKLLSPRDNSMRMIFCEWCLHLWCEICNLSHTFCSKTKLIFLFHSEFPQSAEGNPSIQTETHFQRQFSVIVWAGVNVNHFIGLFSLSGRIDEPTLLLERVPNNKECIVIHAKWCSSTLQIGGS